MSPNEAEPERKSFDPNRIRTSQRDAGLFNSRDKSDSKLTMTVSQLTRMVKQAVQKELPRTLHVIGELSNVSRPSSGHVYFTLKDASCELRCVMWQSSAKSLRFDLEDGAEVLATGSVDVYEPRGQYQLYVRRLEPRGVGALELAFAQLKDRLGKEGLFDPARKRLLPRLPRTIAVVTSPTGAAVRDITQTLRRRFPKVRVLIYGVLVQGKDAAEDISGAIRRINHNRHQLGNVDVMIVGRGGGSLEDLWAFNEEAVARAIFASRIPVVSAVGHEVDFTIADFAADVRAATPTAAAELVTPKLEDLYTGLDGMIRQLFGAMRRRLELARSRLTALTRSAWFRDPAGQLRMRQQQIDEMTHRLRWVLSNNLSRRRSAVQSTALRLSQVRPAVQLAKRNELLTRKEHRLRWAQNHALAASDRRLRAAESRLRSVSPSHRVEQYRILLDHFVLRMRRGVLLALNGRSEGLDALEIRLQASSHEQVLRRGFSITRRLYRGAGQRGKLIKKAADVRIHDLLVTQTADGDISSRVTDPQQGELFDSGPRLADESNE